MPGQKLFIGNKRPDFYTDKYGSYLTVTLSIYIPHDHLQLIIYK